MNVDAAIGQHTRVPVNPADSGVGRNNSFQTLPSDSSRHSFLELPLAVDFPVDAATTRSSIQLDEDCSPLGRRNFQ